MAFKKLKSRTKREEIYEEIKRHIIYGELTPGQQINISSIAEEMGVSLMPVREAFLQLEADEIVLFEDKRKIVINYLTAEELQEIFDIRVMLEGRLIELACGTQDPAVEERLGKKLAEMERNRLSPKDFLAANFEFHFHLYSYAEAPFLLRMIEGIWARVGPYLFLLVKEYGDLTPIVEMHRDIYSAFVRKDVGRLKQALVKDLTTYTEFLLPRVRKQNLSRKRDHSYSVFFVGDQGHLSSLWGSS